jgi:HAE1 family hydrophobic/amphiphilic exporter-1
MGSEYINDFTTYQPYLPRSGSGRYSLSYSMISDVDKYYVRNQAGTMVPLGTLVSYSPTVAAPLISHFNIFRTARE